MNNNYTWYHWDFFGPLELYHRVKFKWSDRRNMTWRTSVMVLIIQRKNGTKTVGELYFYSHRYNKTEITTTIIHIHIYNYM